MKIGDKQIFLYGGFYDADHTRGMPKSKTDTVVIYNNPERSTRLIGSLEGVFVSTQEDPFKNFKSYEDPLCLRDQMEQFQDKYRGTFITFDNDVPVATALLGEIVAMGGDDPSDL